MAKRQNKGPKAKAEAKKSHKSEDSFADSQDATHSHSDSAEAASEESDKKVHLEFFGSDILRAQAPEVMEIADQIAEDWIHDGDFDKIPVGNPVAQALVGKGLRKAKEVEKKLEEKGVFLMARMGADYLKSKIKRP